MGELAELGVTAVGVGLLLVGHVLTTWWVWTHRLPGHAGLVQWICTQLPYLVTYTMTYVWFFVPFPYGQAPALGYLPWAWAALAGAGWLTVWWLRTDRSKARHAIIFLAGLAILFWSTAVPAGLATWNRTYAFGLRGEQSPRSAINAVTSLSCLNAFGGPAFERAGELARADCPEGPDGGHDPDLDLLLTSDQPKQAFQRWWTFQHQYHYFTALEFWDEKPQVNGDTATVRARVELRTQGRFLPGDRWFHLDKTSETWVFTLERTMLGGWKVSRIEVSDPIKVTDMGIMP